MAHFIEVYYPCIRAKAVNPHAHKDKPYLPGHLFIHVDLQENPQAFLDGLPGSRGLVMDGTGPAVVPDALIGAIRRQVDQINATGGKEVLGLPAVQVLAIQDRPLTGYQTLFSGCLSGEERVRRLIRMLCSERQPVEVPGFELNP